MHYWSTLRVHAPYFDFMCYDITWVSNVCITCQPCMVAGYQWVAQKTCNTVPSILVFCPLPQAFSPGWQMTITCSVFLTLHMSWQKLLTYIESNQYNFFPLLVQPPSAHSTIIHDGAKSTYDWSGKFLNLATHKKSLEEGQFIWTKDVSTNTEINQMNYYFGWSIVSQ